MELAFSRMLSLLITLAGVRVLHSNSSPVADIKEGRSEPIRVKDKRGVANQKPDCPSLDDKISCLHKISKNGRICRQLSDDGIKTVKDLLRRHTTDQASLRQKNGNIPGKCWEKIIEHAKSCEIDNNERYIYQYFTGTPEQPKAISLLLNCIYEPVALAYDGQNFNSLESLDVESKRCVETIKQDAYKNLNDLKPFEASSECGVVGEGQGHMVQPWAMTASYIGGGEQVGCSSQQPLYEAKWEGYMSPLQVDQFLNYPLNFGGDYGAKSSDYLFTSSFDMYLSNKNGGNTQWAKLRNALKWTILYAANRKAKLLSHYHY
ncbi:calmodulin-binding protein 60 B-like [Arachis duranensis]|uniref:Calmodulin-binding protein 60 B-like n=1 Tax=Arachis duranensis TaxID=130453 RepID=A0A9C6WJW3_ARADU|nr:calmodulin-binding protein 60 B-like [Arachis duranensis]